MSTTKVRGYRRVSTDEQALSGYSLDAQKDGVERFVAYHRDWTLVDWYTDDGYSAKSLDRPAIQRLLREAQPGDTIIVYKLDRLTRSSKDLEYLLELAEKQSIYLRSASENIETSTAAGRMFIRQLIQFAQFERETIAERTAMGMRQKKNSGGWLGGTVPFGYVAVDSDRVRAGKMLKKLVPDEKNAHLARAIFERYLAGSGVRAIAKWLNEVGAKTSRNAAWRSLAVIRVLKNPAYCGYFYASDGETLVQGEHQPLIDRETWDKVQSVFDQRKLLAPREATGKYPLTGVCRCGSCLAPITITIHRRKKTNGDDQYYYRCKSYHEGRKCGTPALTSFVGPVAEAKVKAIILEEFADDNVERFIADIREQNEKRSNVPSAEIDRLRDSLAEIEASIKRWDDAYGSGRLSLDKYLEKIEGLDEQRKSIVAQLDGAGRTQIVIPTVDELRSVREVFATAWDLAKPHEKKALLLDTTSTYRFDVLLHPGQRVSLVSKSLPALPDDEPRR